MNQMTTSFRNFIGPLRVEYPRNILKKGPKISETGAGNYLIEKKFFEIGAL